MKNKTIILLIAAAITLAAGSVGYGAQKTTGIPSTIKKEVVIAPIMVTTAVEHQVITPVASFSAHPVKADNPVKNMPVNVAFCVLGVIGCFRRDPGDEDEGSTGGGAAGIGSDGTGGTTTEAASTPPADGTGTPAAESTTTTTETETAATPAPAAAPTVVDIPGTIKAALVNSATGSDDPRGDMIKYAGWLNGEIGNVLVSSTATEPTKTLLGLCVKNLKGVVEDTLTELLDSEKTNA